MCDSPGDLLHPLLSGRRSPTSFDPHSAVSSPELDALVEAARWAPSAGNSQPWAFLTARRGDDEHTRLMPHIAGSAKVWAGAAGLLVANMSHRLVEGTQWEYSEFSVYDLGQAVAHMTIQAHAMGLHMRQFRAFDRDAIAREFNVPTHWEVTTMAAIGHVPPSAGTAEVMHQLSRTRRTSTQLRWPCAMDADRSS